MLKKDNIYKSLIFLGAVLSIGFAAAASIDKAEALPQTDNQKGFVINTERISNHYINPDYSSLVDSSANVVIDSFGSLEPLMRKLMELKSGANKTVSIVHVGDSHLQADYWSGHIRELIQQEFGDAGRGLITPYKLAGTNEPRNYSIQTLLERFTFKATERGLKTAAGPTGIAVGFEGQHCGFDLWSKSKFNTVTVLHHPLAPMLVVPERFDSDMHCTYDDTPTSTRIALNQLTDTLQLRGTLTNSHNNPTFYGFSLENGMPGVLYHMIGLNGAAFEHFADHTTLLQGGAADLNPDLIVISLGTNNCFGSGYRSESFARVVDRFIGQLTEYYPNTAILMTTPMESCSRRTRRSAYKANPNVADVARVIREKAWEHGIACWDMFSAAGGDGANQKWHSAKLVRDDRIHFTEQGYLFLGDMMYDALARYYNEWVSEKAL